MSERSTCHIDDESYPRLKPSIKAAMGEALGDWYRTNRRELPWRHSGDPYRIWISEVMLQQTQVKTVLGYYRRFMERFPDVFRLANADLQTVLKIWEGLGYYTRARNLHKAAGIIARGHGGRFPDSWDAVRQLPGIGDYIASAVLSIAFGQPFAVVDGNVKRVLSRLFLLKWPVNHAASHSRFQVTADRLLDRQQSGDHNQAMMELGALVCKPRKPACTDCPLSSYCRAFNSDLVQSYPKRNKRTPIPERHMVVGAVIKRGRWLLVKRAEDGFLGGMWEFPGGAVNAQDDPAEVCQEHIKALVNLDVAIQSHAVTVRHTYTHFKLQMDVFYCRWIAGRVYLRGPAGFKWAVPSRIGQFPLHGAIQKALRQLL